jgi:hypothetical protein
MADDQADQQTGDDQSTDQAIQIDQDIVQQALVSQDNQQAQDTSGSTLDWREVAKRALALLQGDNSD